MYEIAPALGSDEDEINLKCSFCGLPFHLTHGLGNSGNDKLICGKCINNAEIMEKIKLDNETQYSEIIENPFNKLIKNNNEILDIDARWLTDLTIEDLRIKAKEYEKPDFPEPVIINNIPIHKNKSAELLYGEIFKKHSEKNIEVSNMGRVKYGDCILEQYDPKNNGYLFVDIKSKRKNIPEKVYRLVAETWLERPKIKEPLEAYNAEGESHDNYWYLYEDIINALEDLLKNFNKK